MLDNIFVSIIIWVYILGNNLIYTHIISWVCKEFSHLDIFVKYFYLIGNTILICIGRLLDTIIGVDC